MAATILSSYSLGWLAIAAGVVSLAGLVFLILFFTLGGVFGPLNDLCIGLAAILSGVLAWGLYPMHQAGSPTLSLAALVVAVAGALVAALGSVLVIFGITGWYLAGLYMAAGNALLGLWLLGANLAAQQTGSWPHGLVLLGLVAGALMAVGLVVVPGILAGLDAQESAPWFINLGYVGALGWLILYPVWCFWLGRLLLLE